MFSRQYHNPIINDFSRALQDAITVGALCMNVTLLRILFTSTQKIGAYRYLIATFAISDLIYTSVHWLVYPIPEMYGNAFLLSGHGIFNSRLGPSIYCGVYSQAFPILASHFIYRLMALRNPYSLRKSARFFTIMLTVAVCNNLNGFFIVYVMFAPDEESISKIAQLFTGNVSSPVVHTMKTAGEHIQALYWTDGTFSGPRIKNLIGAFITAATVGGSHVVIVRCSYLINKFLKENARSTRTMALHRALFRSCLLQAIYPSITTYYPLGVSIFMPIFGVNFDWVSTLCPTLCVSHPLFDPLILIMCMSEYRTMFLGYLGINRCTKKQSTSEFPLSITRASISHIQPRWFPHIQQINGPSYSRCMQNWATCDALDIMKRISQKMFFIAHDKGCRKTQKEYHYVFIAPKSDGYVLYLIPIDKEEMCLVHEISCDAQTTKKMIPYSEDLEDEIPDFVPIAIPEIVFKAIEEIPSKFACKQACILQFHLNDAFSHRFLSTPLGEKITALELFNVVIDDNFKFIDFILQTKISLLTVQSASERVYALFDEEFIEKFSLKEGRRHGLCVFLAENGTLRRWTPSRAFLPALCRYYKFALEAVVLNLTMLQELLSMALETLEAKASWNFLLNSNVELNDLQQLSNVTVSSGPDADQEGKRTFTIKKNDQDEFGCKLTITHYLNELHDIEMEFNLFP